MTIAELQHKNAAAVQALFQIRKPVCAEAIRPLFTDDAVYERESVQGGTKQYECIPAGIWLSRVEKQPGYAYQDSLFFTGEDPNVFLVKAITQGLSSAPLAYIYEILLDNGQIKRLREIDNPCELGA